MASTRYKTLVVLRYFAENKLPTVMTEWKFAHPERKWAFDFAWPEYKIALEVEGGIFSGGRHGRGSGIKKDMEKYNAAAVRGWLVLRVMPKELCMADTVLMVSAAMLIREIEKTC